jgi:hypothetical protein
MIAMRARIAIGFVFLLLTGSALSGCAVTPDARYVYQDGEFGVIAIPKNTNERPRYYRTQAESLMARHFPQGYEIVRAEEVVEGSRTLTRGSTGAAEIAPQVTSPLVKLLNLTATVSRSQADTLHITECRIIYKKADGHRPPQDSAYARESTWTPTSYVDPNALARKQGEKEPDKPEPPKKDKDKEVAHMAAPS